MKRTKIFICILSLLGVLSLGVPSDSFGSSSIGNAPGGFLSSSGITVNTDIPVAQGGVGYDMLMGSALQWIVGQAIDSSIGAADAGFLVKTNSSGLIDTSMLPPSHYTLVGTTTSVTGESIGTGDGSTTSFSHTTADADVVPGSMTVRYSIPTAVSAEASGTSPDGSTLNFSYTLAHTPVVAGTTVVSYTISTTTYTTTDDGGGNLTGTDITTGTVNYSTGAVSLTFSTAPDSGSSITTSYSYSTADTATDNAGTITGTDLSGTITYATGAISLTFTTAPANVTSITVDYTYSDPITLTAAQVSSTKLDNAGATGPQTYILPAGTDEYRFLFVNQTDYSTSFQLTSPDTAYIMQQTDTVPGSTAYSTSFGFASGTAVRAAIVAYFDDASWSVRPQGATAFGN